MYLRFNFSDIVASLHLFVVKYIPGEMASLSTVIPLLSPYSIKFFLPPALQRFLKKGRSQQATSRIYTQEIVI